MTGNTKVWRAPLAGLASLAMIATMGVAAGTANAADAYRVKVTFKDASGASLKSVDVAKGASLADYLAGYDTGLPIADGADFAGWLDGSSYFDFDAALTKDVTLKADIASDPSKELVKVEFDGQNGKLQFPDGAQVSGDTTYYYVRQGAELDKQRVPVDVADGTLVKDWTVDDGTTQKDTPVADLAGFNVGHPDVPTLAVKANNTAYGDGVKQLTVNGNADGFVRGANADGNKDNSGSTYVKDVVKGDTATVPEWVYSTSDPQVGPKNWVDQAGNTVALGATVTLSDDVTLTPSDETVSQWTVKFLDTKGNTVAEPTLQQVSGKSYGFLADKDVADIFSVKVDNYVVKGWKLQSGTVTDTDGGTFAADYDEDNDGTADFHLYTKDEFAHAGISQNTTFVAVLGGFTDTVKVTFEDASYRDNNKSVTVDGKGGAYLDASKFPAWTRDGYILNGWKLKGTATAFSANTLLGLSPFDHNFTVVAQWVKADKSVYDAAIQYIKPGDLASKYFTAESWAKFTTVYNNVKKEAAALDYNSSTDKLSDEDASKLVSELKAGWEQLKLDASGNPTLSATDPDQNPFVYRLHKDGLRLYSQTPAEIYAAQRTGWTLDNGYLFRAAAKGSNDDKYFTKYASFATAAAEALGIESDPSKVAALTGDEAVEVSALAGKLDAVADPILNQIERYSSPNGTDWVYTSNPTEQASLKRGGWSHEGTAFVVPTFGGTPVVRFALNGQHLMSTGVTEQNALVRAGWTREGVAFRAL